MKKFLLMLAMMLPCLGAWAQIQPSTSTDTHLYKIKNKRGIYMAAHSNPTEGNYGRFAFYAVDGKDNTYKIYSYDADLWLSYTMASGYSNGMNFVTFASTQDAANEWYVTESGDYYQVAPYNTAGVAGKYWNFFGGIAGTYYSYDDYRNTLGLYEKGAAADEGSAWSFEAVDANDYAAPETLNYEVTDGEGNVYTGTYTGVAGRTRLFTPQNACPIENVTFEGNTYRANITFPFPVSNAETTNKLMINGYAYNKLNFKVYAKESTTIKVDKDLNPTTANVVNYLWAIYPTFNDGVFTYTIKNIATDKYIYTTATSGSHGENVLSFSETATPFTLVNDGWGYSFKVADKTLYLSINSSNTANEQPVGLHGNTHAGSSFEFIPYVIKYTLTDAANNNFTGEYEGWAGLQTEPTLTGAEGYSLTEKEWNADANTLSATITFTVPVSSQTVINPVLIRQGSWNFAAKKWCAVKEDGVYNVKVVTKAKNEEAVPELGLWQWVIYPKFDNGNFTFNIMNAATGTYVYTNPTNGANAQGSKGYVTLNKIGTDFTIVNNNNYPNFAYKNNNNTTLKFTINSENDTNVYLGAYGGTHAGNNISFPNLTSFNVKVGSTGYASLYTPIAGKFGEGVETYAVTKEGINDNYVTLTSKDGVAANQGVIVKANEGTYTFTAASDVTEDWTDNLLTGSSVNTLVNESAYVLGLVDGTAALALAAMNMTEAGEKVDEGGTHFLNNAGKAYLPTSAITTTAQVLRFNFGGTTGIEDAIVAPSFDANAPIYDLSGRRVVNTVKGGLYIKNGKKFIVK